MSFGIVGAGRMGLALARAIALAGEPVLICGARDTPAVAPGLPPSCAMATLNEVWLRAERVLLAVPFPVAFALVSGPAGRYGDGRTLIDTTNPRLCPDAVVPPGLSGGELIAEAASTWRVAKAFNTVPASQLDACRLGDARVCVPVAGVESARAEACAIVRRLGFEPLDAGDIDASRELESLAVLLTRLSTNSGLHGRIGIHIGQPVAAASPATPCPPELNRSRRDR